MPKKNQKGSPLQAKAPPSVQVLRTWFRTAADVEPAQKGCSFNAGRVLKAPWKLYSSW